MTMTIIVVLISLTLVSYQGARRSARDGKRKVDLEEVRSALEMYRADCGSYPTGDYSSGDDIRGDGSSPSCSASVSYIIIPDDSLSDRNYAYSGAANAYYLCTGLEVDTGDDYSATCTGGCGVTCNYQVTNP